MARNQTENARVLIPDSSAGQSNKKKQMEKHCFLCQKYGRKPTTHNTGNCTKYKKDGTVKPLWSSGKYLANKTKKKLDGNSYAQIEEQLFAKIEKSIKKALKSSSCKKKHCHDSDSDFNSK
jgi:hypothetical protein